MTDEIEDPASSDLLPATTARSLSAVYGRRLGFWQSLSLLLNAGLMVYAHFGLSAVILSNQQRIEGTIDSNALGSNKTTSGNSNTSSNTSSVVFTATGLCSQDDYVIWETGGMANRAKDGSFCALEYNENGCILDQTCYAQCFETAFGYSTNCATCFAAVPLCSLQEGCFMCQSDSESEECITCTIPCNDNFQRCSGLSISPAAATNATTSSTATEEDQLEETETETCARQTEGVDVEAVDEFFIVYKLEFFPAVETAWNSSAKLLAILVVLFSGIFPYAKNVILMLAWYLPLTIQQRSNIFTGLKAIGKYTLVDVYIVILLMIGLLLELNIAGGIPLIIKGEPRGAITAFLVATIWEFLHMEWMAYYHDKYSLEKGEGEMEPRSSPPLGRTGMCLLLATAIVLFITGSTVEVLRFTTILAGETNGCPKSYSLYTLGAALVSDFFLYENDATLGVWTLCIGFFLLVVIMPLVVHLVQFMVLAFTWKPIFLCKFADSCWTFASVEVLLLAIFIVQVRPLTVGAGILVLLSILTCFWTVQIL